MGLYRIPWPWDYHEQGALIVEASTQDEALGRARAYADSLSEFRKPDVDEYMKWDAIESVDGFVTEDRGCDC